ncbi:MAG: haloacid dehalogenase [Candidatus Thorarchaeota archaeon]|nr:haloacid dehalogenase [Candidatus Thorarchaeota archaeon]
MSLGIEVTLSDILASVRKEIEADDSVRERVLPLGRDVVRMCSQAIKAMHRRQFDEASEQVSQAAEVLRKATQETTTSSFISRSRLLDTAYQELTEATSLLSLLIGSGFVHPDTYGIPSRPYLTGLADTIGELRRAALDHIREGETERASTLLTIMEEILDELQAFDYPEALIPDLRRKCDVARSLIERTRGELTSAVQQEKLICEIRAFEKRLQA